jgi:PAS domain S-box-containing protein
VALAATMEHVRDAVIVTDASLVVIRMNAAAERLTGVPRDEAVGRALGEVAPCVEEEEATSADKRAPDASGQFARSRCYLAPRNDSRARREVSTEHASFVDDEGGGSVLVIHEVVHSPRASHEADEAGFRALVESSPDLVVVIARDGNVVYANAAAARALGFQGHEPREPREELRGQSFLSMIHADDRDHVTRALLAGNDHRSIPARWVCKDGGARSTEMTAVPLAFDGAPAIAVVARDVTERNEIQAQLLRADRMAALGTLAAGVAHEINNPLTYLLVNVEHVLRRLRALAASDSPLDELEKDDASDIIGGYVMSLSQAVEGANRVRQIVRDLMTFSQGNVEQRGLVDVRGVVESAIQMAWHEIRHRARLVKSLSEVPPVEASEARLGQVFLNLLVNAAQAIPEGHANEHEVRVATRTDEEGRVVVEVSDTGAGIEAEALPRVFDPFFTTKAAGAGTGLGLSISHGTVRSLGGDLTVTSERGTGTTFRVVLPAAKAYLRAAPAHARELRPAAKKRILVIDDEPLVGHAVARVLSDECDVKVMSSAREALDALKRGDRYDVILCDLMMPVMTGMDLYAEVVRTAPGVAARFVFMTGGAFTQRARAFLESVSNPYLEKPLEMSKLRSLVARAGERAATRE